MEASDRRIGRVAAGQHSLVTRQQLLAAGLSERQVDFRVTTGLLHVAHRGVYRMPGVSWSYERDVLAACLATGGVASHRCAAALFKLRGFERYRGVEITVVGQRAPRLDGVVAHKTNRLERTRIGVVPVTMPAQTLLDLAGIEPRLVEGALADALRRELVRLPALVRYLQGAVRPGRPGGVRLRELVEEHVKGRAPTASWLEDRVLEVLRSYGLPEPVRQFRLDLPGRRLYFDFAYPEVKHAVEADGRLWHTSPADLRRDRERDQAARLFGWTVERVTWLQLHETPAEVVARVAASLAVKRAA